MALNEYSSISIHVVFPRYWSHVNTLWKKLSQVSVNDKRPKGHTAHLAKNHLWLIFIQVADLLLYMCLPLYIKKIQAPTHRIQKQILKKKYFCVLINSEYTILSYPDPWLINAFDKLYNLSYIRTFVLNFRYYWLLAGIFSTNFTLFSLFSLYIA